MEIISSRGKSVTFYLLSIWCPKIIHATPCHATRNNSFRHRISLQCCSDPDWIVPMQMHSIATRNENTIQNRQIVFRFRLMLRWSSERRTRKLNYFRFYFLTSLTHTHTRMEKATPVRTGKVQLRLAIVVVNRHLPIESNSIPNGKPHRKEKMLFSDWMERTENEEDFLGDNGDLHLRISVVGLQFVHTHTHTLCTNRHDHIPLCLNRSPFTTGLGRIIRK